ncbi:MAG: aminopeptidase [Acidobacteriota bacterium]|nr:aminopeptidase [Acidobacteriota bacterium]
MSRQGSTRKRRLRRQFRRRPRVLALAAAVVLAALVASCGSVRYYSQAVWGGADVLVKRKPIDRLLEPGRGQVLSAATRERLGLSQEIRDFASRELGLPDNRSYRSYADLGRPYAVWNVVATPRLSLEPKTWCYPFAGCAAYRGYFNERAARRHGDRLAAGGESIYGSDDSDERKLARKAELFRALPSRYRRGLVPAWRAAGDDAGGESNLGGWLSRLNNADLVSVATYSDLVPAFLALLERSAGDLPAFYAEVERLSGLLPEERRRELGDGAGR